MKFLIRYGIAAVLLLVGGMALETGTSLIPGLSGLIPEAHAVVGRPVTPVSVAGASRRTVRRCAAGMYNC